MIIYRDIITGDEMFTDVYKIKESSNGVILEVEGKMTSRTDDIDDSLLGANPSGEELAEGTDSVTVSGVDIVLNCKLQETNTFNKDSYKSYIKEYLKAVKKHLEENNPERVKPFMTGAQEEIKKILANFKNYQFFTGESMNPDGMVGLLDFREDGITPYMLFFKDGLLIEKC